MAKREGRRAVQQSRQHRASMQPISACRQATRCGVDGVVGSPRAHNSLIDDTPRSPVRLCCASALLCSALLLCTARCTQAQWSEDLAHGTAGRRRDDGGTATEHTGNARTASTHTGNARARSLAISVRQGREAASMQQSADGQHHAKHIADN